MDGVFYSAIYIVLFVAGFVSMLYAIKSFAGVILNIKNEKKVLAHFIAPIIIFFPGILTEAGKKHRINFIISSLFVICSVITIYSLETMYGKPPYMEKEKKEERRLQR